MFSFIKRFVHVARVQVMHYVCVEYSLVVTMDYSRITAVWLVVDYIAFWKPAQF